MNWVMHEATKVIIRIIIVGALAWIGLVTTVVWIKMPALEESVGNHTSKITALTVNLMKLRQETGHLDEEDLEKLFSSIEGLGREEAERIETVELAQGSGELASALWWPTAFKGTISKVQPADFPLTDKTAIGAFVSWAAVLAPENNWAMTNGRLEFHAEGSVFVVNAEAEVFKGGVQNWVKLFETVQVSMAVIRGLREPS